MASSGMLRLVVLVRTDVLEELSVSIIRVTRTGELGMLAITSNRRTLQRTSQTSPFLMKLICSLSDIQVPWNQDVDQANIYCS
jgi:hypothetical protein